MPSLRAVFGSLDVQVVFYVILALIPNLFLILWVVARLSRDVRLLKAKHDMMENDINLIDQSISSLTSELQVIRKLENQAKAAGAKDSGTKATGRP